MYSPYHFFVQLTRALLQYLGFKKTCRFLVFFVVFAFLTACNGAEEDRLPEIPAPPIAVEVSTLDQKPTYFLSEVATVEAAKTVEIVAEAAGTLETLTISLGDQITEGQLIGTIDVFTDATARINLDNARIQLLNARQNLDETLANNQDVITKTELQIDSIESTVEQLQSTTIDQLERNLNELETTNQSTLKTFEIQVENARKNVDNAQINRDNVESQFDQTWESFFKNVEVSFESIFVNANGYYQTIDAIVNPSGRQVINQDSFNRFLGIQDPNSKTATINLYNSFTSLQIRTRDEYDQLLPLGFDTIDEATAIMTELTDGARELTQTTRAFLDNSGTGDGLTQAQLDAYKASLAGAVTSALADANTVNQVGQNIQSTQLQQDTQLATAENNLSIANNQLNEAQNALNQFKTTSQGSQQDLQVQIDQTRVQIDQNKNNLASAQADKDSAERSAQLQESAELLRIESLENQVRLAESSFSNNRITAAIGGTISELNVDAGDYVGLGTVIGKIIFQEELRVVFFVTESEAKLLTVGQAVSLFLPGQAQEAIEGTLNTIAPTADPANRKIKIEVMAEGSFRPEMLIRVEADVTDKTFDPNGLYVDLNWIIFGQNDQYVYVARGDRAERRTIEIGQVIGQVAEVTNGLAGDELLVTEGHRRLNDEDKIVIESYDQGVSE